MPVPLALVDEPVVYLLQLQPRLLHQPRLVLLLTKPPEGDRSMIIGSGTKIASKKGDSGICGLSLTVGYGHLAWACHQAFRVDAVSPGSFPALRFRSISSLMSTSFSLYPCKVRKIILFTVQFGHQHSGS